jgi:hypothetical protein
VSSRYASLSRQELAVLVPELLLIGHLIDRAGMPACISAFGREGMQAVAIEEWAGASPIYTRRMQRALGFEGDDVVTIFKGMQLDVGAPPQFLDIEFALHDPHHGEFRLRSCGALADVEPMGSEFVHGMCHDIEDPTFDATAAATNPRAQVRPIHRPPRVLPGRTPVCAWTVTIEAHHPVVDPLSSVHVVGETRAAEVRLDEIDLRDAGDSDYAGPLRAGIDFSAFSRSALVRIADEVCMQMHLLALSFAHAVDARADAESARDIRLRQLTGISAIGAERIRAALALPASSAGAMRVLELHPLFNPSAYVDAAFSAEVIRVHGSPAHEDGAWISLCGPGRERPLRALVQAVAPTLDVAIEGDDSDWVLTLEERSEPARELPEVAVVRFSTGVGFRFEERPPPQVVRFTGTRSG